MRGRSRRVRRQAENPSGGEALMAIATVTAGAYTSAYGGQAVTGADVGFNDENGFELEQQTTGELVNNTDLYGETLLDFVIRGGNVFLVFASMVWDNTTLQEIFYPFDLFGVHSSAALPIGRLATTAASDIVLTAVANTPAASEGPITLTGPTAILPPNSNQRLMFSSRVRKVPCRLALLPAEAGGEVKWFTTT